MAWTIEFDDDARRSLRRLDQSTARQITRKLREIATLDDATDMGKPLRATRKGFWVYRVGDYRLICSIQRDRLIVLVIEVQHRSQDYR